MVQHLGLLSFILIASGLVFTVVRWPAGIDRTFSQHAAVSRGSQVYYSLLFIVTLPPLYLFLAQWFAPTFGLGRWFVILAAISMATQVLCTFFPEVGGWSTKVHRVITGISGVLLLPLVAMVALSSSVGMSSRVIASVSIIVMIGLLIVALKNQEGYRHALYLQIGYYALFFMTLFAATYIR